MGDIRPDDAADIVFVGSSSRAPKPPGLTFTRAYSDAPLSAKNIPDSEFLAVQSLGVLFTNVLLREQLKPLKDLVELRQGVEHLDPLEFKELFDTLQRPVVGPLWQISQWRFADSPTCFVFKGWRQGKYPATTNEVIDTAYSNINETFRDIEHGEGGTISMDVVQVLYEALEFQYQFIEDEIDPHLKRVWVENEITRYEQWEGERGKLPGRLTPEFVEEKLRGLRTYQEKFKASPEGTIEYRHSPRPSMN